jgi:hypothetical protein
MVVDLTISSGCSSSGAAYARRSAGVLKMTGVVDSQHTMLIR